MPILETKNQKIFKSDNYNYTFNKNNGYFERWGKTKKDNPEYSPFGPEILDIEISTSCSNGCSFCYKSNTANGNNMSFETFKKLFDRFPKTLTQIAFGVGDIDANPDLFKIIKYCRDNEIIPNITVNGRRLNYYYNFLSEMCGAVAVSLYDKDVCYDAVKEFTDRGMKQINIHCLLSEETFSKCLQVMKDKQTDSRLKGLNAIVFLWLKPKGKRNQFHQLQSMDKFKQLINYAFKNNISIGFDSCSASNFLKAIKGHEKYKEIEQMMEPCESTLFSYYINVDGVGFPCSFSEDIYKGIDVINCNFMKEAWYGKETLKFRDAVMKNKDCNNCRMCPIYDLKLR